MFRNGLNNACECSSCRNELNLEKLCAKKIKAHEICVKDLKLDGPFCAESLSSPSLCCSQLMSNKADVNSACIRNLNVISECVQSLTATNIGVSNLVANNLCVPGELKAANFLNCGKYRASVCYSAPQTYTLGTDLGFNFILDDPNNNVTFSPTIYHVPISGYYIISLKVNASNLQSPSQVLGSPVGNPEIYVNGLLSREQFLPWLAFNNASKILLTSLISLKAGDLVTMKYKVLALDGSNGLIEVIGTVDIFGNGIEDGNSLFKISLLNADCSPDQNMCQPSVPCMPCSPLQCAPCKPSDNDCDRDNRDRDCLRAPVLNPIFLNPGSLNSYMVSWSAVSGATSYTLEVSPSANFTNPSIAAFGNFVSWPVNNQPSGSYFYRVFASNGMSNSPYSNVQSILIA